MKASAKRRIHVVAGVLRDPNTQRVLLAQRPNAGHLAGYWEFPGGKVEVGEGREAALQRELCEEIGISAEASRPHIRLVHEYDDRVIDLDVWLVSAWSGTAVGNEGQAIAWVAPGQLAHYQLPPADEPVLNALRCGERYLITPEPTNDMTFYTRLEASLSGNSRVSMLQLRIKLTDFSHAETIVTKTHAIARRYAVPLLINGDPQQVRALTSSGVHLPSRVLRGLNQRPAGFSWVGASCHDALELRQAERVADFAVLSPVASTTSHPDAVPLGWDKFATLVASTRIPVFALGGMTAADVSRACAVGGQGVAAISSFWQTD